MLSEYLSLTITLNYKDMRDFKKILPEYFRINYYDYFHLKIKRGNLDIFPNKINELYIKFMFSNTFKSCDLNILNNLPFDLKRLNFTTCGIDGNSITNILSNLPPNLIYLSIKTENKINLDNLPVNLKTLILNYTSDVYTLDDFNNLPTGLKVIKINNKKYNSKI